LTDVPAHVDVDSRMNGGCAETPPYIGKRDADVSITA